MIGATKVDPPPINLSTPVGGGPPEFPVGVLGFEGEGPPQPMRSVRNNARLTAEALRLRVRWIEGMESILPRIGVCSGVSTVSPAAKAGSS
jgi:hypothetical protein